MSKIPKIELHCHLDGSLRPETVYEWLKEDGEEQKYGDLEKLSQHLIAPVDCDSLDTYLKRFQLPVKMLQSAERLKRASYELMEDAFIDGVKYIEIRYAPELHTHKGMQYPEIIEAVIAGIRKAEKEFDMKGNVILSYLRMSSQEGLFELVDAGHPYLGKGVVAVDLCASEDIHFAARFSEACQYAKSLGYGITIHAGETGYNENIVEAIEILGASRIGHGVAMASHPETKQLVRDKKVCIECCPTSNLQTKAVADIYQHPVDDYYNEEICLTLNTDNRTVSDITLSREFDLIHNSFQWTETMDKKLLKNGIEASFANIETKQWLSKWL